MADLDEDYYVDESFEADSDAEELEQEEEEQEDEQEEELEEEQEEEQEEEPEGEEKDKNNNEEDSDDDDDDDDVYDDIPEYSDDTDGTEDTEDTDPEIDPKVEFLLGNPHARRQMLRARARQKMPTYPSSSSDEESQVVITKTVAEVNPLALRMDTSAELEEDEDPDSGRTLKPGSDRYRKGVASSDSDEEVDDEEEVDDMKYGDVLEILEEDGEEGQEEREQEVEEQESEGAFESEEDANGQSDNEADSDGEVNQLEEHEPEPEPSAAAAHDVYTLADDSDNSSERSLPSDRTLINGKQPTQQPLKTRLEAINETETDDKTAPKKEPDNIMLTAEQLAAAMPPMAQLEQFLNEMSIADSKLMAPANKSTPIKLLEHQMSQMSAMIMKTIRTRAMEGLGMETDRLRAGSARVEDAQSTTAESSLASARSCDSSGTKGMTPQAYGHCRCPSTTDYMETDQQLETVLEGGFYVDECGQGDGLMRHPHQRRPPEYQRTICSATPSSYTSNVTRSRSSTDKMNYKNLGRKNFSFTNEQMRIIERQNHILLQKMMAVKPTVHIKASTSATKCNGKASSTQQATLLTSAAVNRKKYQRQINLENNLIKRKLDAIHARRPEFK
ncbi:protein hemingway isoform X2 [Drosophila subobscura]|uniref:protein hemingway isoform X2 n=1 Tax=Drosophila subobscura TaxID=7241 RepID=UPI00155A5B80|nr:protein hemingway isoform X2 [Drosophila subobscura]